MGRWLNKTQQPHPAACQVCVSYYIYVTWGFSCLIYSSASGVGSSCEGCCRINVAVDHFYLIAKIRRTFLIICERVSKSRLPLVCKRLLGRERQSLTEVCVCVLGCTIAQQWEFGVGCRTGEEQSNALGHTVHGLSMPGHVEMREWHLLFICVSAPQLINEAL